MPTSTSTPTPSTSSAILDYLIQSSSPEIAAQISSLISQNQPSQPGPASPGQPVLPTTSDFPYSTLHLNPQLAQTLSRSFKLPGQQSPTSAGRIGDLIPILSEIPAGQDRWSNLTRERSSLLDWAMLPADIASIVSKPRSQPSQPSPRRIFQGPATPASEQAISRAQGQYRQQAQASSAGPPNARQIFEDTGAYYDPGSKSWVHEIIPRSDEIIPANILNSFDDPSTPSGPFDSYPLDTSQLANPIISTNPTVRLHKSRPRFQSKSSYNPETNEIVVHAPDAREANRILQHELQHSVQEAQNMPRGADASNIPAQANRWATNNQIRQQQVEALRNEIFDIDQSIADYKRSTPKDQWNKQLINSMYDRLDASKAKAQEFGFPADYAYHTSAGEVMARNAERRSELSAPSASRKFPLDTADVPYNEQWRNMPNSDNPFEFPPELGGFL